jgi:phage repressor protein C with HTH and peptisase S24 domain
MTTLKERLIEVMEDLGISGQRELADFCDVSEGLVTQWFQGSTGLGPKPLKAFAAKTDYSLNWLSDGSLPKRRSRQSGNADTGPELRRQRLVPVVGDVRGGADGYLDELLYPAGHGDGCVPSPVGDASAYAVRVRGESMFPRYRAGEFVILAPMLEAMPGDDVVAILHDGRKMLKVLGWIRGDEIQLLSINNGYAPITLHASEIQALHVVAGTAHRSSCVPC